MHQQFYALLSAHGDKCTLNSLYLSHPTIATFSLATTSFFSVLKVWFFVSSFFHVCSFVLFLKFHVGVQSNGVCLSLTDSFPWALYPLGPSKLQTYIIFIIIIFCSLKGSIDSLFFPSTVFLDYCSSNSPCLPLSQDEFSTGRTWSWTSRREICTDIQIFS